MVKTLGFEMGGGGEHRILLLCLSLFKLSLPSDIAVGIVFIRTVWG